MAILNIGDKITYTTSTGTFTTTVDGRNFFFDRLESYAVIHNGVSIPIDPKTFKCQLAGF